MAKTSFSRRQFLQMSGVAAGAAALAACVPAAPAPTGGDTAAAGDGGAAPATSSDTLWVLHKQDFHPEYNEFMRQHIQDYAAENGYALDVAFTAGFAGTGADIQKVAAAVQAGDPPDVWVDNINPFQLNQLGTLQPVTDLQEEVIAMYGPLAPRPQSETLLEDEYVGVTLHSRSDGGWARKDIFEAAGIDLSTIRTYEQLRDVALELSDPDGGMWGWGITTNRGGDGGWYVTRMLHGWGATWTDETGQYVTVDSPETIEAIEWMVDTYTNPDYERMLPPGVLSWTDTSNNEAYLGGTVAYTQNAGTVYAKAVADGLEIAELTAFHPPVGGPALQEFNGLGGMYAHLIQGAKNAEGGRGLIMSFFTDEVMQAIFTAATNYAVPSYDNQWEWELLQNQEIAMALKPVAQDPSGWNGLAWPGPSTAQIGAVGNSNLHTDMVANVISGQMTAAEAAANAAEQSIQIFQEFGAPGVR